MTLASEISQWLALLHRGGTWAYWWIAEDKRSEWWRVGTPTEIPRGAVNIYVGVHPTHTCRRTHERARVGDIVVINCLFADLDAKQWGGEKEHTRAHIESLDVEPSVIVDSGGGYHAYWLFADPFFITNNDDRERAKQAQANWVAFVGGDRGAKDLARVLRVPGTLNHKYDPPPPVAIVHADFNLLYAFDELEQIARQANKRRSQVPALKPSGNGHDPYAEAALAGELDKLAQTTEGARNTQLNASAFALGQLVGAGMLDRADVEARLFDVARAIGLTDRETRATIRSGITAGMREPRAIPSGGNGHGNTSPRVDTGNTPSIPNQAGQYVIRDGRICRIKRTQDGAVIIPLCNFVARITAEVARDDGADDVRRVLTIEGRDAEGRMLPTAEVDTAQFAAMRWVTAKWGVRAIVEAGTAAQDHLRAAIQYLSPHIASRQVFTHTGWRMIRNKRVFLTQSGALGGDGIAVELDRELERYRLPTQPRDVQEAMRKSLGFFEIAPLRVTVPLWSAMYLAPLAEIIPIRFMPWVYGATGVFKSTLAAVALSHYGAFTQDDLIQWSGTANSLEKYTFLVKDAPLVLDDFAPQTDPTSAQRLEQLVARLVRDVGNHGGRSRLKSDLSLQTIYRPRGLVISTGEQLPNGQSIIARLVTVEVNKGDVDVERLTEAQDDCAAYPNAMAAYILWLAQHWQDLQTNLPQQWRGLRARTRREGQHARLPESIASLYVGLDLGLTFAVEIGALTAHAAENLRGEGWAVLGDIAERQRALTEEQRPTWRFLTVIAELVAQGKARLDHTNQPGFIGDGERLGWYDENYLYLLPSASYHLVARYERDEGRIFGIKENALRKMLAEEGLSFVSDKAHYTARVRVAGEQPRVLKIAKVHAKKISGVSFEKPGTVGTDA